MVFRKFISNRNEQKKGKMTKPMDLGLLILEVSKVVTYGLWYDYIKPKYEKPQ